LADDRSAAIEGAIMSGRKQHFIPQSLLKGFGRPGKGDKIQVIVYHHDHGIFAAATDGIAAEREFYSKLAVEGEGETLDDKITAYESSLADTLTSLRDLGDGDAADNQSAAEFVTHLVIRNDHLRKFMETAGTSMFGGFSEAMSNYDRAKTLIGLGGDEPSDFFAEQIDEAFEKYAPLIRSLGMSKDQFREFAFAKGKADFGSLHAQILGPLQSVFSNAMAQIADTTADAHRRSLGDSIVPEPRVEKMKEYDWRVVHTAAPLILPDCVAIAYGESEGAVPLMFAEAEEAEVIYVPLSSNRLLIGSKGPHQSPSDLNEALASCAWDFFVAGDRTPELEAFSSKIRSRSGEYVKDRIDGIVSDTLQSPLGKRAS
jgi:hypothetical protein